MADFTARRKAYQRYRKREDNAFARIGDVKDLFSDAVTVSGIATIGGATTLTGAVSLGSTLAVGGSITSDGIASTSESTNTAAGGVAGTNCTAIEYGDGYHHITVLTLTDVVLGAPTAAGNSAHGSKIYSFPAGVHLHNHTYFSVGLTVGGVTTDAPDIGVGSVIGAGAIAVLNGTTMEDYVTGITWGTALDGTAEVQATVAATAGVFAGISNNAAADVKDVFFNAADGWNAAVTGNLTASGTVVLVWDKIA